MQLKTCTNPDRIMKHRHKILHSMEIAFSHVLWFEKKRETDSERQMETHGARRKRGGKKKRGLQRVPAASWSPTEGGVGEQGPGPPALSSPWLSSPDFAPGPAQGLGPKGGLTWARRTSGTPTPTPI